MTVPAVLCVDVEPDLRAPAVPSAPRWTGFERLYDGVDRLRKRLAGPAGRTAQIGWFLRMDQQVAVAHGDVGWVADRYAAELRDLVEAGDELGLHPHSWRWEGDRWCSDQSPDWVARCATDALDAYEAAFGSPCRAYRHGDRFTSSALLALVHARGVRCDLGLEPGLPASRGLDASELTVGEIPGIPADWVQPFAAGVHEAGDDDLLMLPLTSSLEPAPSVDGGRFGTLLLWSPPRTFAALLAARLAAGDVRHLAFAIRTDITLEGRPLEWVEQNLEQVGAAVGADLAWVTPSEARRLLLPTARQAVRRAEVWPHALTGDRARTVARDLVAGLQHEELARMAHHSRADAVTAELAGARLELQDARVELAAHAARERDLRHRLDTIEATRTWRLHQRLLPALRLLRRWSQAVVRPRGGSPGG